MPRKPRVHYYGALYHVIGRGNNRENIFAGDKDKNKYLDLLKRYKGKFSFLLYAYVLMNNHVHLLIEVKDTPLSKIMQGLQLSYTQYFNKKYKRAGHVFQQRYQAIHCDKDEYFITLIKYIHLNPVRAGIGTLAYRWSSHKEYARGFGDLVDVEFPLRMFHPQKSKAIKTYLDFIAAGENEGEIPPVPSPAGTIRPGTEPAAALAKTDLKSIKPEQPPGEPGLNISPEKLLEFISEQTLLSVETILKKTKKPGIVRARRIFLYLAVTNNILSRTQAAGRLGIGQSAVTKALNEIEDDRELMVEIEKLEKLARRNFTK